MGHHTNNNDERESRNSVKEGAVDQISSLLSEADYDGNGDFQGSPTSYSQKNIDKLIVRIQEVHKTYCGDSKDSDQAVSLVVEGCFAKYDKQYQKEDQAHQFELTEKFILEEQTSGHQRRSQARRQEAEEELRLAAEIAQLKGFRENTKHINSREELQRKISDAERAYFRRKMVVSKSSQVASAECRIQFARVREFFEELHGWKTKALTREHARSVRRLEIIHRLKKADARVRALEMQIADRVYKKKLQDLNELHIAQNMEEAIYMESMLGLLDKVQDGKNKAAKDVFETHVQQLKFRQSADQRRSEELNKFRADAMLEIAALVATYVHDDKENAEAFQKKEEQVEATERRKSGPNNAGKGGSNSAAASVGDLYDAVLWSVVKNHAGLTSSSSDYSSDFDFEEEDEEDDQHPAKRSDDNNHNNCNNQEEDLDNLEALRGNPADCYWRGGTATSDGSSTCGGSVNEGSMIGGEEGGGGGKGSNLQPAGQMHVKQLTKDIRRREKEFIQRQKAEDKQERISHRSAIRSLKKKYQNIIDGLIEGCLIERQNLREGIEHRMTALAEKHESSTEELREAVMRDALIMQEALMAEDRRVSDAETASFSKAQAIISAQVFHEVRNALSSVIAMSEIAYSMKKDSAVSAEQLVSSVEDMLDQIKEVVDYALKMLNNVLDISKITSGTFQLTHEAFNIQDLVARATRMQLAKSGKIKMHFNPSPHPSIAYSDSDIVVRIVTNMISNALKFTTEGSVQPFVCPLEDIVQDPTEVPESCMLKEQCNRKVLGHPELELKNKKKRLIALGVADTGSGLTKTKLRFAETAVSNCDPRSINAHGARNSGFGLYLTHLLAKALGSQLRLSSLEKCRNVLNQDMLDAMDEREKHKEIAQNQGVGSLKSRAVPGRGTVLYIVLPVYKDGEKAKEALHERDASELFTSDRPKLTGVELDPTRSYTFLPRPAPSGSGGSFRIMVADDVLMLRKGIVHALSSIFQNCPVSISTACTAEDLLRAVSQNPYDLVICDNLFHHDASKLKRLPTFDATSSEDGTQGARRPSAFFDAQVTSKKEIRDMLSSYFANEMFTLEVGDGEMTGFEAIMKLAKDRDRFFPTPVLMVLSGHKIEVPPDLGIIVAQKPLRQNEFIHLLESSVPKLLNAGICNEDTCGTAVSSSSDTASMSSDDLHGSEVAYSDTSTIPIVNCHGTQLFVSHC